MSEKIEEIKSKDWQDITLKETSNLMLEVIQQFEKQYDVEATPTGDEMEANRNGGIYEKEFWINGLIESKAEGLNFEVGGWFSIDVRDNEVNIYCLLVLTLNGEEIGNCEGIQTYYNDEEEEWEDMRYDHY